MNFTGVLLAISAAFFAFSWRITVKTKLKPNKSDIAFTALVDFFAALTIALFIPFFGIKLPTGGEILGLLLVSAFLSGLSDFIILYATKNADTADTSILMPLSNIWVLLFGFVFLKEALTFWKVVGVLTIVIGSTLALSKNKKLVINKGIIAAFLYGFLITGTILIDKGISSNFSLPVYGTVFYLLCSGFLALLSGKNFVSKIKEEFRINNWWLAAIGVQWALFTLSLLYAYSQAEASRVIPIMRVFIVMITTYSVFVLREKERMWQKIIGSVLVTGGALILAYMY